MAGLAVVAVTAPVAKPVAPDGEPLAGGTLAGT